MPLRVRNREPNTTVFGKMIGGEHIRVMWGAYGQPTDVQRVPNSFVEDIDFLKCLDKGILEVIDAPAEVMEELQRETDALAAERREQQVRAETMIDRQADKSMLARDCLGPAVRPGTTTCGTPVLVLTKAANDTPPLCALHADRAHEFVLELEGSKGENATTTRDGEIRHVWTRVQMAPVVKGT